MGPVKSTVAEAVGWALFDSLPYNQDEFVREGILGDSLGEIRDGRTDVHGPEGNEWDLLRSRRETADAELELGKKEEVVNWLRRTFGLDGKVTSIYRHSGKTA